MLRQAVMICKISEFKAFARMGNLEDTLHLDSERGRIDPTSKLSIQVFRNN